MRTTPLAIDNSMDFTLVGTAVPEADVVPTGIAVGAHYEWLNDGMGPANLQYESRELSELWQRVRTQAHQELRRNARSQANGVLAHVNFSQAFKRERDQQPPHTSRAISWWPRLSMRAARRRCPMTSEAWWICIRGAHH